MFISIVWYYLLLVLFIYNSKVLKIIDIFVNCGDYFLKYYFEIFFGYYFGEFLYGEILFFGNYFGNISMRGGPIIQPPLLLFGSLYPSLFEVHLN